MKKYYDNDNIRAITQSAITSIQVVLMVLSITFMYLFVSTGAGSNSPDYSVVAIFSTVLWCAYYLTQAAFAIVTFAHTKKKNMKDITFIVLSIAMLPLGCAIYGILLLTM